VVCAMTVAAVLSVDRCHVGAAVLPVFEWLQGRRRSENESEDNEDGWSKWPRWAQGARAVPRRVTQYNVGALLEVDSCTRESEMLCWWERGVRDAKRSVYGKEGAWTATNFLSHWWHIFTSYLAMLRLSNEQTDGIILVQDENEWIADATVFDLGSPVVTLHVLDDLPLCAICCTDDISSP
jgi:hypothetical protein